MRNHIYFKSFRWTTLERCASCSPRPKLLKDGLGLFRKMLARVSDFVFRDFCEIWNLQILPKISENMRNHIYFKSFRWTTLERCTSCSPRPKLLKYGLGLFRKMLARVLDFVLRDFCEIWNLQNLWTYQKNMINHIYFKSFRWTTLERCASCSPRPKLLKYGLGFFRKMIARVLDFVLRDFCEIWDLQNLWKYQKNEKSHIFQEF